MFIEVRDELNVIFNGEADDFLEINDYDEEIKEALNELNSMVVGSKVKLYGNFTDVFEIEKMEDDFE